MCDNGNSMFNKFFRCNMEYIGKLIRLIKYCISIILSYILPTNNKRIIFWASQGKSYSCNPKYLSEYIQQHPDRGYDIYWAFLGEYNSKEHKNYLTIGSLKYLWILNTSKFIVTNQRTRPRPFYWRKKKEQKYIMTWHGSMALKVIEKDALSTLETDYRKVAQEDSRRCDLMLSDSKWWTNLIRQSFWYDGEILECGVPRNDIFFDEGKKKIIVDKVHKFYNINKRTKIVLYAPTFRQNKSTKSYITEWTNIIEHLKNILSNEVVVLVRLHPWLLGQVEFQHESGGAVVDATRYQDMQELLISADILITDFSSTMFEFSLLKKPCFLVAKDLDNYDRGTYFNLQSLPFIQSKDTDDFCRKLEGLNISNYLENQASFIQKTFEPLMNGGACEVITNWMDKQICKK